MGLVLQFFASKRIFPAAWIGHALGWPLFLAGASIAAWAVKAAGNLSLGRPDSLVESGPYEYTRNPMYVGWYLVYVGTTFVFNTIWPLVLLPVVVLLTRVAIIREERALEDRFGAGYRSYKTRVRRYI